MPHAGKTIIKLENVWKVYRLGKVDVPALRGVSLNIHEGEFVAIMGPSGSGKSTLMNMVGALDVPTRGRVLLDDQDISKMSESSLAQLRGKKIGFVFQQFNLIYTLTAAENVMLPMIFQGYTEAERKQRARELLEMLGLGKRLSHRPYELSGGEQQRVAMARALANNPEIVLADEPTGNLDSTTGKQIMDLMNKLHREENKTMVMVTHDPYVAKNAERVLNIKYGKLLHDHILSKRFMWELNYRRGKR